MNETNVKLIEFKKIGSPGEGYLSIGQSNQEVPFEIKRTFWTYFTPDGITRGRHAHYRTEMILIALSGIIEVMTEELNGAKMQFTLKGPHEGLYLPALTWHEMSYSHTAVQLVLTNSNYDEKDYIRSYLDFQQMKTK
jgi:hypothetical protein